jgi:hypothetical protein
MGFGRELPIIAAPACLPADARIFPCPAPDPELGTPVAFIDNIILLLLA